MLSADALTLVRRLCEATLIYLDEVQSGGAPGSTGSGSAAVWSDVEAGEGKKATITIDDSIYPDPRGVLFLVNGEVYRRVNNERSRPEGFDLTGPREGSTYHIYPARTNVAGDVIGAAWVDTSGLHHYSEVEVVV